MQERAVFLDRDGVINPHEHYINTPEDFELYPWAGPAIHRLNQLGWRVFVVTNQGGVGLGYFTEENLKSIHKKMISELAKSRAVIEEIAVCMHRPKDRCRCRKPEAGMILQLANTNKINLQQSYMIGDRDVDIAAGKKAGTKTIFIGHQPFPEADYTAVNLAEAVDWIERAQMHEVQA